MTDPTPELDQFFKAAQAERPIPSTDLMARVRADAQTHLGRAAPLTDAPQGLGRRIMDLWPVWSTCVPAALVGLWVGVNPPALLPDPANWIGVSTDQTADSLSDFDDWAWTLEEGQL